MSPDVAVPLAVVGVCALAVLGGVLASWWVRS
jgi:hypothetical protein